MYGYFFNPDFYCKRCFVRLVQRFELSVYKWCWSNWINRHTHEIFITLVFSLHRRRSFFRSNTRYRGNIQANGFNSYRNMCLQGEMDIAFSSVKSHDYYGAVELSCFMAYNLRDVYCILPDILSFTISWQFVILRALDWRISELQKLRFLAIARNDISVRYRYACIDIHGYWSI